MVVAHRKANFLLWEDGLPTMTAEALSACSPSRLLANWIGFLFLF